MSDMITTTEAGALVGYDRRIIAGWIQDGLMPYEKITRRSGSGYAYLVRPEDALRLADMGIKGRQELRRKNRQKARVDTPLPPHGEVPEDLRPALHAFIVGIAAGIGLRVGADPRVPTMDEVRNGRVTAV